VLSLEQVSSVASLSGYGHLVLLQDGALQSYSLRTLAGVVNGTHTIESFAGSVRILARDGPVLFFESGEVEGHTLGMLRSSLLNFSGYCSHSPCSGVWGQRLQTNKYART
jgi:hypothetical protein